MNAVTYIDRRGQRSSTESAYFTPDVLSRRNLKVLTGAHVTRILLAQDHATAAKRAVGVEFSTGTDGVRYRVRARHEVVLAFVFASLLQRTLSDYLPGQERCIRRTFSCSAALGLQTTWRSTVSRSCTTSRE